MGCEKVRRSTHQRSAADDPLTDFGLLQVHEYFAVHPQADIQDAFGRRLVEGRNPIGIKGTLNRLRSDKTESQQRTQD